MLADDLADALALTPGLTAAELATVLGGSEQAVSFALFAGHGLFRQEKGPSPRWWLATAPAERTQLTPTSAPHRQVSPLPLYAWQQAALDAWARAGRRGVVEAVTGAGKTRVGVAAALLERQRRGQVLVLVPTVELQHQWISVLDAGLPAGTRLGRLGDGTADSLSTHDVLVAVVNSARTSDTRPIRAGGLLVADECHRYGSAVNHLALDGRLPRRLGLSATYGRDDGGNAAWLDPYFGGTCFRLGYDRAVGDGVTARFTVTLVGVCLSAGERAWYDELTESLRALWARLVRRYDVPEAPFEAFVQAVARLADSDDPGAAVARSYQQAVRERRRLLADTPAKDAALGELTPAIRAADRALVFTQSIAASERAAATLARNGLSAEVVHSALARDERRGALGRFAAGSVDVLVAPRVLDEGIDVPAADLAVIAGASRSRRQMVQRMGRVLRRKPDGRRARFAVLFVEDTVEDPAHGAHGEFLGELVGVADEVTCLRTGTDPAEPIAALRVSWPTGGAERTPC